MCGRTLARETEEGPVRRRVPALSLLRLGQRPMLMGLDDGLGPGAIGDVITRAPASRRPDHDRSRRDFLYLDYSHPSQM